MSTHYDSDIRALLFDLGNVLVEIDFSRVLSVWASYAGITAEELVPRFSLQDKDHERFERGEITSAQFFNSVRETLRIDITNAQFLEGWNSVFVGEITGIDDVVKRASLRYPLYVFSNTTLPHHVVWQNLCPELLTKFKKIFVSYELGLRKPDEEAFYAVAEAIGEPIHKILFFDDTLENVSTARKLGMPAVEVRSIKDLNDQLDLLL